MKKIFVLFMASLLVIGMIPLGVMAESEGLGENNVVQQAGDGSIEIMQVFKLKDGQMIVTPNSIDDMELQDVTEENEQTTKDPSAIEDLETNTKETDFQSEEIAGGIRITRYVGNGVEVKIPMTIGGAMVLEIGANAFMNCGSVTSVIIPKSVVSIGSSAFSNCEKLGKIVIPSNVKTIGENVFEGSDNVTIYEFEGSPAEKYATANKIDVSNITESNNTSFQYVDVEGGIRITQYTGNGGAVVIPSTINGKKVLEIGGAFLNCTSLTDVTIPEGVTAIDFSFSGCTNLKTVKLPASLRKIGPYTFQSCHALKSMTIPEGTKIIQSGAFNGCINLETIVLPGSVESLDSGFAMQCGKLSSIAFSSTNPNYSVSDNVVYNKSLTTLLQCAGAKTSVNIPTSVKTLDDDSFHGCYHLSNVKIPDSVTAIGNEVFQNCRGITTISLSKNVSNIGDNPFAGCQAEVINVDTANPNFTSIDGVLYNKTVTHLIGVSGKKSSVVIPTSVTTIGKWAFSYGNIESISIPSSVTSIENWAFFSCDELTQAEVRDGMDRIGGQAFSYCDKLSSFVIKDFDTVFDYMVFSGSNLVTIYGITGSTAETYAADNNIPFSSSQSGTLNISKFNATPVTSQYVQTTIQLAANATGGTGTIQYQFSYTPEGGSETVFKNYSTATTASFTPTKAGNYTLTVKIKDGANATATKTMGYQVVGSPVIDSFTTNKASGQAMGTPIGLSASGSGGMGEYQYKFYAKLGNVTIPVQDYSSTASATFTPAKAGTYTLCVDMKDKGGKVVSKTINGYNVVNPLAVKTFTAGKPSGQAIGSSVTLNASGSDGKAPYQYKFTWTKDGGAENLIRDYGNSGAVTFKPEQAGTYTLKATIKDSAGNTAEKTMDYVILPDPKVDGFTVDTSNGPGVNCGIGLTAKASEGKAPYQFKFYYKQGGATTVIQNFGAKDSATFKPAKAGDYALYVDVKDANGRIATSEAKTLTIYTGPTVTSLTANPAAGTSGQYVGTSIALSATASGGTLDYSYAYYYKLGTGNEVMIRDYDKDSNATFTPAEAGSYTLIVKVKDKNNIVATKSIAGYKVIKNPVVKSFTASKPSGQAVNTSIILSATGAEGKAPYQYQFSVNDGTTTTILKSYSILNMATFKPAKAGTYTLSVDVKDAGGVIATRTIDGYVVK